MSIFNKFKSWCSIKKKDLNCDGWVPVFPEISEMEVFKGPLKFEDNKIAYELKHKDHVVYIGDVICALGKLAKQGYRPPNIKFVYDESRSSWVLRPKNAFIVAAY